MTNERFNEILNGPLWHPLLPFQTTRLALALRAVVDATGEAGAQALERHVRAREAQDDAGDLFAAGTVLLCHAAYHGKLRLILPHNLPMIDNPHLVGVAPHHVELVTGRHCRKCGCTDADARGCVERTGQPCTWVEADLCSACVVDEED